MEEFTWENFKDLLLDVFKDSEPKDYLILENWSSIEKLLVVGAIYENVGVLLTHADIREVVEADELFRLVLSELKS